MLQTECWTAVVPHAACWPYEVHAHPNRRLADLPALSGDERAELSGVYRDLPGRFERPSTSLRPTSRPGTWHLAPVDAGRDECSLHLELFTVRRTQDKLKYLAGSDSGMDAFVDDVAPETAAEELRRLGQ